MAPTSTKKVNEKQKKKLQAVSYRNLNQKLMQRG
jgi:hypothetical protein